MFHAHFQKLKRVEALGRIIFVSILGRLELFNEIECFMKIFFLLLIFIIHLPDATSIMHDE